MPVEVILQHRRVSTRGPGAHPMGPLAQPAFVDEDDGAPRAERFFFKLRPAHSLPIPDGFFVALQRAPRGALAAPAQPPQDAPDVSFVISHPALVLDEFAHPARSPQPAGIAQRLGTPLERLLDLLELGGAEPGLAPGSSRLPQTGSTR